MTPCSRCKSVPPRVGQKYCRACHAAYMRENRPRHSELPPEARRKANVRSYANTYQQRGKLVQEPCQVCGDRDSEKHHPDYSQPLLVEWLCRPCHLNRHVEQSN